MINIIFCMLFIIIMILKKGLFVDAQLCETSGICKEEISVGIKFCVPVIINVDSFISSFYCTINIKQLLGVVSRK